MSVMSVASPNENSEKATISTNERTAFENAVAKHVEFAAAATLETSSTIPSADFTSCFDLIVITSADAYKASSKGWSPRDKKAEMRHPAMRYIVMREKTVGTATNGLSGAVSAFLSYMLTTEGEDNVVYIYEVHVSPTLQGQGIGAALVRVAGDVGATMGMAKAMLTVFASNEGALRFYARLGFEKWDEEPVVRKKLRSGTKASKPTYLIYAWDLKKNRQR